MYDNVDRYALKIIEFFAILGWFLKIFCSEIRKTERFVILDEQIWFFMPRKAYYNYLLFRPYFLNIWIIFGHQNLTKYCIEYHFSELWYLYQILICKNAIVDSRSLISTVLITQPKLHQIKHVLDCCMIFNS